MADFIYKVSWPSQDEIMALYCHANGWDVDGNPNFRCDTCGNSFKASFGCGFEEVYRGKMQVKGANNKYNLHGTCPGYWRRQDFVIDTVEYAKWRANLGHPTDIPNRLFESVQWLDYHTVNAEQELDKIRRSKI